VDFQVHAVQRLATGLVLFGQVPDGNERPQAVPLALCGMHDCIAYCRTLPATPETSEKGKTEKAAEAPLYRTCCKQRIASASTPAITRLSLLRSSSPSHAETTTQATPLPTMFVSARHSLMKRSMPRMITMPATGSVGTTASVAASVMKPAPVTPLAPLDVSIATPRMTACCCQ